MIQLYVLGPLDLPSEDGRALDEVPSQPKRAASLAYLAAATPRGYRRRDVLLGVFWPELDPQRARQGKQRGRSRTAPRRKGMPYRPPAGRAGQ